MLTFSDFVQILHVRLGGNTSGAGFLVSLTAEIMSESLATEKYPLDDKSDDMLRRIYAGDKELPKKDAREILVNIDRERFKNYLLGFSNDVRTLLYNDLTNYEATVAGNDVVTICTNLFVQVLDNCAKGVDMSVDKKQSLLEQVDLLDQDAVFIQAHKLLKRAEKNKRVAQQLREIFVRDGRGYCVETFIREYIGERIESSSTPDADEDSINDIHGWLQTVYENCLETETYNETTILFEKLNDYIGKSLNNASSCTTDELTDLSKEIVDLLIDLCVAEDE